jgi:hypothetical protein
VRIIFIISALLASGGAAMAHGAEELGHHWEMPAYRTEMYLQIILMAAIAVAAYGVSVIKDMLRQRRSKQ